MAQNVFTDYVDWGGARQLPTFRGYTVDVRCREFRKIDSGPMTGWEFIDFDSDRGEEMLQALVKIIPADSILFYELGRVVTR